MRWLLLIVLVCCAASFTSAYASSVQVTKTTYQADSGVLTYIYFETSSGPGNSTPTTNTAQTPSSSSNSYQVSKSSSAYLWTPQFAKAATLSQSSWVLDLWASCTTASAISVSIYTTNSGGTVQSTILSSGSTSSVPTSEAQIVNTFSASSGTIPSSGYIEVVLTVSSTPRHCVIYWGSSQQTNFQVPYQTLST